jgi:tetratricopeptide (TPR) repeat protein
MDKIDEAAEYINRALSIADTTKELYFYAAVVRFRQGKYTEAYEYLEEIKQSTSDQYVEKFKHDLELLINSQKENKK